MADGYIEAPVEVIVEIVGSGPQGKTGPRGPQGPPGDMDASVYDPQGKKKDIFAVRTIEEGGTGATTAEKALANLSGAKVSDLTTHTKNKANPHGVTLSQVGGSNPNLLDNWYFADPINQRGASGTISEEGYFIDRWMLVNGTVQITSAGLVLNGEIQQLRENAVGADTSAMILTSSGMISGSYDDSTKTFSITATGETLIAAKLELGSEQTLAHQDENGNWVLNDPPPNKQQELAKCQRYAVEVLNRAEAGQNYIAPLIATNTARAYGLLPQPETMRDTPSALYSCSAEAPYWLVGIAADGKYTTVIPVVAVTVYRKMEHGVVIYADINAEQYSLAPGNWYQLYVRETNKHSLLLTADL